MGIQEMRKDAVYFDGTNTTNRILDVLEQERPKIILIDEIDKAPKFLQNCILNFMESGKVDVEQQRKQYHFEIKGAKIFATANDLSRSSKPLQSRFRTLNRIPFTLLRQQMTQTKTIAILLLMAVAVIGTIGIAIGTGIQSVHAFGGWGPGQNDNSQGNNNNQGSASRCGFGGCENLQGNQN